MLSGVDIAISDPSPAAESIFVEVLANAVAAWDDLGLRTDQRGSWRIASSVADAVTDVEFIQESVPERPDVKAAVLAQIEAAASPDALIGSSTSGILPTTLQSTMSHRERLVVGHPYNPVYLLPVVELVPQPQQRPGVQVPVVQQPFHHHLAFLLAAAQRRQRRLQTRRHQEVAGAALLHQRLAVQGLRTR